MPNEMLITRRVENASLADPENGRGNVRSDVNRAILRTLNDADVEIPEAQRVVRQAS